MISTIVLGVDSQELCSAGDREVACLCSVSVKAGRKEFLVEISLLAGRLRKSIVVASLGRGLTGKVTLVPCWNKLVTTKQTRKEHARNKLLSIILLLTTERNMRRYLGTAFSIGMLNDGQDPMGFGFGNAEFT